MIGAIIGDIAGSRFEFNNIHTKDFELFNSGCYPTDDSCMTFAVAEAILRWDVDGRKDYESLSAYAEKCMRYWGNTYPHAGYGGRFRQWLKNPEQGPYNSCGNGSAMRVSPVGWAANSLEECRKMSKAVTEVTHNHPDGILGAEATAVQIFLAKNGSTKKELKEMENKSYYPLKHTWKYYQNNYSWSSLCDKTCQPAFLSVYESKDFEDAVRNSISIGGDSDTLGAICGGIAEAVYGGVPEEIRKKAETYLDERMLYILHGFEERFPF